MKKFELTDNTIVVAGVTLHQIRCTIAFREISVGDIGGFVENESNICGDAWVFRDARVFGGARVGDNARVCDNARVGGNAWVFGDAVVYGDARVGGNAWVFGDAEVYCSARVGGSARVGDNAVVCGSARVGGDAVVCGNAWVGGDAKVFGNADYIVFKNWWSSGRYFTWTRSNNMWRVGCFYGNAEELIKKAYKDSDKSGREYERIVQYVNEIIKSE